jgi:hypothetical protein
VTPDLEKFARKMFELADWPEGGDIYAWDFQAAAIECGLLVAETRTEPCGEGCFCDGYYAPDEWAKGVTCYRKAVTAPATG